MPQVDMSRIPVETQQAVAAQQGATNQSDMTTILATLAQDPQALAAAMQQLGLDVTAEQLQEVAEDWVERSADDLVGDEEAEDSGSAESEPQPAAAGDDVESDAEGPPADTASASPAPTDAEMTDADAMAAEASAAGVPSMPNPAMGSNSAMARMNNPIDDIISAQMMQSAVGNPNAPVPQGMQVGRQQRPGIPASRMPPSAGGNKQQQMIAEIFRQRAGKQPQKKRNA